MIISKVHIENYKSLSYFDLAFNNDLNIIVGDNEAGKSSLLEAINIGLTGQLNNRNLAFELTPYLFNKTAISEYINKLRLGELIEPPKILIEVYLKKSPELSKLQGTNNSKNENIPGLSVTIQFNEDYVPEYEEYISNPADVRTVPTEYYEVKWFSFAGNAVSVRSLPINTMFIDTSSTKLQNGTDFYIQKTIDDILEKKERAGLSLLYRKLKETFSALPSIQAINTRLKTGNSLISHKDLTVSLDVSQKTNWDSNLTSYLNEIPFNHIGKGDQNVLKMVLALERKKAKDSHIILIEEPETHLSFSTMAQLINMVSEKCEGQQLIITTHNAYVLNKLGIEKVILLGNNLKTLVFKDLPDTTQEYFKRLPGYDTLRLILAKKTILVEGPSDELFFQKAYFQTHGKLPIDNGIDVLSVRGLSFKRFLDIAKILGKEVVVITDNDGNCAKLVKKYKAFEGLPNIRIKYDLDENYRTLELLIVRDNNLSVMNSILEQTFSNTSDLIEHMLDNKTEWALKFFNSKEALTIPNHVQDVI